MKPFLQLLKANIKQLLRDKTSLFFTFAFPVVFMIIFGLIWTGEGDFKANIGLVYDDGSQTAASVSQTFAGISSITVEEGTFDDLLGKLKNGELRALVVIPPGVDESVAGTTPVKFPVYYDPSNSTTQQVVLPLITQVIEGVERQMVHRPSVFQLEAQSIQAHQMRNIDFLVPGIIVMSILSTGLFCAIPLVQQREKKILKRWSATPIRRSSLIYSQVVFRVILAVLQTFILICLASLAFNVQMLGNWVELLGLVTLGSLVLISIGYLIASFVKTEEGAMPIVQLVQFPMMFLSGIFFPIDTLPTFMKPVVSAMPTSYLGDALRQVMVEAAPVNTMALNLVVLVGFLVVCMALSIKFFRWE